MIKVQSARVQASPEPHGVVVNFSGVLVCKGCGHPEKCHGSGGICVEFREVCACSGPALDRPYRGAW